MGEKPWRSLRPEQVVFAIASEGKTLDLSPTLHPEVSSLIKDCWNPQPRERPSFDAIIKRLSTLKELQLKTSLSQGSDSPSQQLSGPSRSQDLLRVLPGREKLPQLQLPTLQLPTVGSSKKRPNATLPPLSKNPVTPPQPRE